MIVVIAYQYYIFAMLALCLLWELHRQRLP